MKFCPKCESTEIEKAMDDLGMLPEQFMCKQCGYAGIFPEKDS